MSVEPFNFFEHSDTFQKLMQGNNNGTIRALHCCAGLLRWEPTVMRNVTPLFLECNPPTWYVSLYRVQRIFSLPRGPWQHDIPSTSIKTKKKHRALISDIWMKNIMSPDLSGIWRMFYVLWSKITIYPAPSIRCINLRVKTLAVLRLDAAFIITQWQKH